MTDAAYEVGEYVEAWLAGAWRACHVRRLGGRGHPVVRTDGPVELGPGLEELEWIEWAPRAEGIRRP